MHTLAVVYSRATAGIDAPLVTVETHMSPGLPGLNIVGLPETTVKESRDRVRSALINSGFEFPVRRITINLAPADVPKEGSRFDLPIALGILAASGQIPQSTLANYEFIGELALAGELRAVRGVLPVALSASKASRRLMVPSCNAAEAAVVKDAEIFAADHLLDVCAHLQGVRLIERYLAQQVESDVRYKIDLADVSGQLHPRRALEIAAAGKHSLLFLGPPGTGKTMLASRLATILPTLADHQALEVAAVASVSHTGFDAAKWAQLPFRSPHHSSSSVALVGGGRPPRPGEISLAHHGILFLDELPEFNRHVLESLREPLESGHITISRAAFQTVFPAEFQLVAAMNPCPCGYAGSVRRACRCSSEQVQRYLGKLSGPFLDRIDMHVEVPSLPTHALLTPEKINNESSAQVKARVLNARAYQMERQGKLNQALTTSELAKHCELDEAIHSLLLQVLEKFNMSARVYHRVLKVARTIADLAEEKTLQWQHISEALTFRCLDKAMNR